MMKPISVWKQELAGGTHTARLASLYCCSPEQTAAHAARYAAVLDGLEATFGAHTEAGLYSAPGRTEIGGNHTDHQHGRVLAGSVNIDMIAAAAPNGLNQLRVQSEGYDLCVIDLGDLAARKEEENTTMALLRGECEAFKERGAALSGLDVYISSNVPKGSGVSSSAAFEVLIGVILNDLFLAEKVSPIAIAQIGQWAENVYFGKPCGLMDQMASSVGNIITIDFADKANPDVEPVQVDFSKAGLALCILDSGADHADLTDEYAAIPNECRAVAAVCGGEVLRDVPFETFLANIPACRKQCGDRAVLRAFHFYADNDRVPQQVVALREGDFDNIYYLNGNYTSMTGTLFQPKEYNNSKYDGPYAFDYLYTATFRVYGDGRLLYEGTMTGGVFPLDFNIDLTGVLELRVTMSTGDYAHGKLCEVALWT